MHVAFKIVLAMHIIVTLMLPAVSNLPDIESVYVIRHTYLVALANDILDVEITI